MGLDKEYTLKALTCNLSDDNNIVVGYLRADLIGLWGNALERGDKKEMEVLQNSINAIDVLYARFKK